MARLMQPLIPACLRPCTHCHIMRMRVLNVLNSGSTLCLAPCSLPGSHKSRSVCLVEMRHTIMASVYSFQACGQALKRRQVRGFSNGLVL